MSAFDPTAFGASFLGGTNDSQASTGAFSPSAFGAGFQGGSNTVSSGSAFSSNAFGASFNGGTNDASSSGSAFSSGAFGGSFNGGTNDTATTTPSATKVDFNGTTKTITIHADVSEIDVRNDIYSAWKEWAVTDNNLCYVQAFRISGGDPISATQFTGDIYFLINGWQIEVDHSVNVNGVIYSDDYPSPFRHSPGTSIVTNKVSSLVQTVNLGGTSSGSGTTINTADIAAAVWAHLLANSKRADTNLLDILQTTKNTFAVSA